MKWMTIKEYAELRGCSQAAVYKMIHEDRIKHDRKYGKLVVFADIRKVIAS